MMLSAIVAMSRNHVIGLQNKLPWHLPDDLKHFKHLTINNTIIMGRKTYESIGKPLPQRTNIILTRQSNYAAPGAISVQTLEQALEHAHNDCFLIGGAEIYKQFLPEVQRLYLTLIEAEITGDTFFPKLIDNEWQEIERTFHPMDEKHAYAFNFITLENQRFARK